MAARVRIDPKIADWPKPHAPPIWTGHQPWHWHPGILAKYLAIDAAYTHAQKTNPDRKPPSWINLVVDHDARDTLALEIPTLQNNRHTLRQLQLAPFRSDVPAGCQPPIDPRQAVRQLQSTDHSPGVTTEPLIQAWSHPTAQGHATLGQQVAAVNRKLLSPWLDHPYEDHFSTQLGDTPGFANELQHLLEDAPQAIQAYNRAVAAVPQARVAPLLISREWIELPVWLLTWNQPRRRVFADVSDSKAWLITETGQRLNWQSHLGQPTPEHPHRVWLAPKALWMTALLRRQTPHCAGFVHGSGGATYDQAMQHWWADWRNENLAPQALATADLTLDLPGPAATTAQARRAVWLQHHLPHNLDRVPSVAAAHPDLVAEKQRLLQTMHDDRDRRRRQAAFQRIHQINDTLADAHHALIDRAATQRDQTQAGLYNAKINQKRDLCFALYPAQKIQTLRDLVRQNQQ